MPPTFTTEGAEAALSIRNRWPMTGVLLLSQQVVTAQAVELLSANDGGVGYLLKDRVEDIREFIGVVRRVAAGGTAIDPAIVKLLIQRAHPEPQPLDVLSERERAVLGLMAEGLSNQSIASQLYLGERTVEAHIRAIFTKLGLPQEPDHNRRVLAVLTHLRAASL